MSPSKSDNREQRAANDYRREIKVIHKPFDDITKADIDALLHNKVGERRVLEYKQELVVTPDDNKKEFLYDVSSFANASGGDLLFGVEDERDENGKTKGVPKSIPGIPLDNAGQTILRLEQIIAAHIRPRLPVRMEAYPGFPNGSVLLIRIPKSYQSPHLVNFKDNLRFYSRNNGGKCLLDIGEIRSAFALSESLPQNIRAFQADRLSRIVSGQAPTYLRDGPKIVLHLILQR